MIKDTEQGELIICDHSNCDAAFIRNHSAIIAYQAEGWFIESGIQFCRHHTITIMAKAQLAEKSK
jgi:hypothetical protein